MKNNPMDASDRQSKCRTRVSQPSLDNRLRVILLAGVLAIALSGPGLQGAEPTPQPSGKETGGYSSKVEAKAPAKVDQAPKAAEGKEIAGVYALVTVDGKKMPATISHDGNNLEIRSGNFTITAEGKCISKMTFVPPSGTEATLERKATSTREGAKLRMQWEGAGTTMGKVDGNTFTMENEGMVLVYKK
jgi:hypothetical protein